MFGMSVFETVLARLQAEDDADEDAVDDPSRPQKSFAGVFLADTGPMTGTARAFVNRAYTEMTMDVAPAAAPAGPVPAMPQFLARIAPAEIAADLGLGDDDTQATLGAKRRQFAALNHPDLHPPAFRDRATTRMKIANMLIDESLKRLPSQTPSPAGGSSGARGFGR